MAGKIKVLPDDVKSRISAGEVVEGPASVVKELIENALDAGANDISVSLLQSGMKRIVVTDNGEGMLREDAPLAVMDHATSKIADVYDIQSIGTYGFRGEALACVAAVARLTILTRHKSEAIGTKLIVENGKATVADYAGAVGTTIIVEDLFYNVPARKKFLKSLSTELRYCRSVFTNAALANPQVSFVLTTEQRRHELSRCDTPQERLSQVYGKTTTERCCFEELRDLQASVWGMLSKPDYLLASRSMQQLFVNGRPVEYRYLSFLLSKAYEAVAPKGMYPAAVLFLTIDPALTDVNVHPAKREIKLFDSKYIDSLIMHVARKALDKVHTINDNLLRQVQFNKEHTLEPEQTSSAEGIGRYGGGTANTSAENPLFPMGANIVREAEQFYKAVSAATDYLVLGQIFDTYILVQKKTELFFIDFHAAHERFIYDELKKREEAIDRQELLFPATIDLPSEYFFIIADNLDCFTKIGFDIDTFSENSIIVRAAPAVVGRIDEKAFLIEAADNIKQNNAPENVFDAIAASAACHSANRAGDVMTLRDMEDLAAKVFSGEHELRCPHGRPFVHAITKEDLERIFKR